MKKIALISFIMVGSLLVAGLFRVPSSYAGVSIGIGINLPVYRFAAPPDMVLIPGTYAYTAPDAGVDIIFYQGYWYRPFEGRWYRARAYNGPWGYIQRHRVPGFFFGLPADYRYNRAGYERIPYGHLRKNWRAWERDRYWDGPRGGHARGRGHDHGRRPDWGREHDRGGRY